MSCTQVPLRDGEGTGDRPSPVATVLLAPVPEGLVNGSSCSTGSVHFGKLAGKWPNIVVPTGGAKYQFDNRGRDRRMIHRKEGWQDSDLQSIRHFQVRLHDLRTSRRPSTGTS